MEAREEENMEDGGYIPGTLMRAETDPVHVETLAILKKILGWVRFFGILFILGFVLTTCLAL